jgi:hypothetical protein
MVWDPGNEVLQLWFVDGPLPPSLNVQLDEDGAYKVVDLDDEAHVLGIEIVNFRHYASLHHELRGLLESLERLPARGVILQDPTGTAGLTELLHA